MTEYKLKIGDRVRVSDKNVVISPEYCGKIGVVDSIDDNCDYFPIWVTLLGDTDPDCFDEDELELVYSEDSEDVQSR